MNRFRVRTEDIPSKTGGWNSQRVVIMDILGIQNAEVGEYVRNYPTIYNTFCPFEKDGRWYALYSRDYTGTRIMTLPECEDIGGEDPCPFGFCPVDYYVPYQDNPTIAFVSGCIWGDDSSWKIQVLDISDCANGNIVRKNLIPSAEYRDGRLENQIFYDEYSRTIEYPTIQMYDMEENKDVSEQETSEPTCRDIRSPKEV